MKNYNAEGMPEDQTFFPDKLRLQNEGSLLKPVHKAQLMVTHPGERRGGIPGCHSVFTGKKESNFDG